MNRLALVCGLLAMVCAPVALATGPHVALGAAAAALAHGVSLPSVSLPSVSVSATMIKNAEPMPTPVVAQSAADCHNVCQDECTTSTKTTCKQIPVTTQECTPVTKTTTETKCERKCSVRVDLPSKSIPATTATTTSSSSSGSITVTKPAITTAASVEATGQKTISIDDLAPATERPTKGAKADKAEKSDEAEAGSRKLLGAQAAKIMPGPGSLLAAAHSMVNNPPQLDCQDVCTDVPVTYQDLACQDVTTTTEQCEHTPVETCNKVCTCVPMKTVCVTLPEKTVINIPGVGKF